MLLLMLLPLLSPIRLSRDREASIRRLAITLLSQLLSPGASPTTNMLVQGWSDSSNRMLRVAADESEAWGVRAAALQFLLAAAAVPSTRQQQQQRIGDQGGGSTSFVADATIGSTGTAAVAEAAQEGVGRQGAALAACSTADAPTADVAPGEGAADRREVTAAAATGSGAGRLQEHQQEEEEAGSIPRLPGLQVVGLSFLLQRQQLWEVVAAVIASVPSATATTAAAVAAAGASGVGYSGAGVPLSVCSVAAALCAAAMIGDPEGVGRELLQQQQVVEGLVRLMQLPAAGAAAGGAGRFGVCDGQWSRQHHLDLLSWMKLG